MEGQKVAIMLLFASLGMKLEELLISFYKSIQFILGTKKANTTTKNKIINRKEDKMADKLEGYIKFSEVEENKLELNWIKKISKLLVGKKIVKIQYMTKRVAEEQGWYRRPIQIRLEDGTWLTPSQDDEGNDGGSLFTNSKDLPTIPVI